MPGTRLCRPQCRDSLQYLVRGTSSTHSSHSSPTGSPVHRLSNATIRPPARSPCQWLLQRHGWLASWAFLKFPTTLQLRTGEPRSESLGQFYTGNTPAHTRRASVSWISWCWRPEMHASWLRGQRTLASVMLPTTSNRRPSCAKASRFWLDRSVQFSNCIWPFAIGHSLALTLVSSWHSQEVCNEHSRLLGGAGQQASALTRPRSSQGMAASGMASGWLGQWLWWWFWNGLGVR